MLTQRSAAELVDYERRLVIPSTNVDVTFHALVDGAYVLQEDSPIYLRLLQPGASQLYRMDITNNGDVVSRTKAMFVNITGDIEDLGPYITFGGSTPFAFAHRMDDKIEYNENTERYFIDLIDEIRVSAGQTRSIYIYIQMSEEATNDVMDKNIQIENIMFLDV